MTFDEVLGKIQELLEREKRVSYRGLKRRFDLDDEYLEDIKEELIGAKRLATDEDGRFLVWTGAALVPRSTFHVSGSKDENQKRETGNESPLSQDSALRTQHSSAERRQLTVMFCDLVGSTALSSQLDPEDLREVVRNYQQTCADIIQRYAGHIAQYLGDGLLVYFGYPIAHEDDAARAVRAGLGIIEALREQGERRSLQVRIGIHTGLVVVGEVGGGAKREQLALGETPNIAARVQSQAAPREVVVSAATLRLLHGVFATEDLGPHALKGISTPLSLYRIIGESAAQSRFEVAVGIGLTPLVGREEELRVLQRRWTQAKDGAGQVVLLSGEAGIGKSRLVQALKEQISAEGATRIEFRCSPYHQNSALYPIIDHLQRLLQFAREDAPTAKLEKLQHRLSLYRFPQADTLPLLAALLSLPHPKGYPPITVSPQKQKEKTQTALIAWLLEEAKQNTLYTTWEDLHWADPSTLEVLTLLLDQVPTTRLLALLTFRPEFTSPWGNRSHLSHMTLSRLGQQHVREMVRQVVEQATRPSTSSGRTELESGEEILPVRAEPVEARAALPDNLVDAVVARTDGVPLFVEELTKTVMETVREQATGNGQQEDRMEGAQPAASVQTLGIPATLQDALMARLDRLGSAKEIAQLGATIGREFSYELLHTVSLVDEAALQQGLQQLVEAELLYQRGLPPHTMYLFKHALIQDTAYHSLLKSTRQHYHQQIAHVLEERFPDTKETQPELLAHHYTEAGLVEQAIPYWQQAGEKAIERSAYAEAISHFTKGREILEALPETPDLPLRKLSLQFLLGNVLMATKGFAALEVEQALARAYDLCLQVGEDPLLFRVLPQLRGFHFVRGELGTARELAEQQLIFAQRVQFPPLLVWAYYGLGETLLFSGELISAQAQLEQGIAYYDLQQIRAFSVPTVHDPKVACLTHIARILWYLGYPDQALKKMQEAVAGARELLHAFSLAWALTNTALHYQLRREEQLTQEWAETALTFSSEQGFPYWVARGKITQGWALAEQGQGEQGISQIHQGLSVWQITGTELWRSSLYALLAEAYGRVGRPAEGLAALVDAVVAMEKSKAFMDEAELYRLKGELLLQQGRQRAAGKVAESET